MENVRLNSMPVRYSIREILLGALLSLLVLTSVGSVLGLLSWRFMSVVYAHANAALPFVGFFVNFASAAVTLWLLRIVSVRSAKTVGARSRIGRTLGSNANVLSVAQLAALVFLTETIFSFARQTVTTLLVVNVGNATGLDFTSVASIVAGGVLLPSLLAAGVLALSARQSTEAPGA